MPAPVIAAVAAPAAGVGVATAAKIAWLVSPQLRWLVKKVLLPMVALLALAPIIATPFIAIAAQSALVSFLRPMAASCAQATEGGLADAGRVFFPLPEGTWKFTSPYGMRIDPISGVPRMHRGADFAAPDGTPLLSIMDGVVSDVVFPSDGNNYIAINSRDANGVALRLIYMHMWQDGIVVEPGMTVSAGDVIGAVGNAGTSTGAHLHLETWVEGSRVDPVPFLATYGAIEVGDCEMLEQTAASGLWSGACSAVAPGRSCCCRRSTHKRGERRGTA